ncbi:Hypothetical protein, putative [Bodo saltans]|uniref:Uncharacterized protein n=1 Tax=Bodo saltans TaxID=75058 RepID=A0A0S4JSW9_BODSA|nr:Hypothetical protein, putative [Bodo saltans]|eukprot:CUG93371.1 Hypothetical protein, putative [Bodo saltans]
MAQPSSPPALVQELQNLFESPSVAYTAVVSLRDQCILYHESAQSFFSSNGRSRLDGSTAAPHPPAAHEVDRWLAAACGAASPFLESSSSGEAPSSGEASSDTDGGWFSATFNTPKWDIIAYRCHAHIPREESSASSPTGSVVIGSADIQQHQLLMVTFRSKK